MALKLLTPPIAEPVSLAEAKEHCRVTSSDDDSYIGDLITVARQQVEADTRRALIDQTWESYCDQFPTATHGDYPDAILIEKLPLQSVTSLTYTDINGATQALTEGSDFTLDKVSKPARIVPYYGKSWPSTRNEPNAVKVTFVAGYGAAASDVDKRLKQAMKIVILHWYINRTPVEVGTIVAEMPLAYERLIANYKFLHYL